MPIDKDGIITAKQIDKKKSEKKGWDKKNWDKKRLLIEVLVNIVICIISVRYGKEISKITYEDKVITADVYIDTLNTINEVNEKTSENIEGEEIAEYALQFVGKPYVYGKSSLTEGADNSGFVKAVYNSFGIVLPHSADAICNIGENIPLAKVQPGDIVCYWHHVGIYVGDGKVIHSSTPATGIKISDMYYREPLCVRRVIVNID